ncbi:MAG TPA: acetamidase/formamidase family protein [Steroidobacteraceae bacterium]|nr:acetamidase/formamidase family protein [Steroidobacteraceae bacterium]
MSALCTVLPAHAEAPASVLKLRSTPETSVRSITRTREPVLRVSSGQIVDVDTVAQLRGMEDPVAFYGASGIPRSEVLQDAIDLGKLPRPPGGGHILTGPIYVEGAEPGDLLEVRIINVRSRVPYGVNVTGPDGVVPDLLAQRSFRTIKFDLKRNVALVAEGVEVPLAPFMGIMAVAPGPELGDSVPTLAPGPFGGNMDFNRLTTGSTLYLPVFNSGALFYTGDPHAAQGDGEVNATAIEASNSATFQFIVHKGAGKDLHFPIAEDKDHFYIMGMSQDLDDALRASVAESVAFLRRRAGMSTVDGYMLSSIGINFSIAEAVDGVQMVYGALPKRVLKRTITVY